MMRKFIKASIPDRCSPLVRRLFEIMGENWVGVSDIAERTGLGKRTIQKWRTTHVPDLMNFEAALNALGYGLRIVHLDKGAKK